MHAGGQVDRRSVTESPVAVPIHKGDRIGADITCGAGIREGGIRVQRQCAVGRSGDGYERNRIPISVAACHDRTRHCECRTGRRVMPGKGILPCGDTTLAVNGPSRSHRCQNRSGVLHTGGQVDCRSITESAVGVPIQKGDRIGAGVTRGTGVGEGGIRVQRQCAVGWTGNRHERNRIPISVATGHDRTRHGERRTGCRDMPGKGILPCGDTTLAVDGPSRSHRCQNRGRVLHAGGQVNGGCVTLVAGTVSISEYDRIRSGVPRITGVSERGICVQRQCPVGGVRCSNQSDCVSIGIAAADDGAGNGERRTSGRVVAVQSKLQ